MFTRPWLSRVISRVPCRCKATNIARASIRAGTVKPCFKRPYSTSPEAEEQKKKIVLTSHSYPNLHRNPEFGKVTPEHIEYFKSILPEKNTVITNTDDIEAFNEDWMRKFRGDTPLVLRPKTVAEVSKILKYCNEHKLGIVPQGGNTGLVGGSVPVFDEIVLSLSGMDSVISFDEVSGILVVEAGAILETVDEYLRQRNHIFPLDLGAKGSCEVGGNTATNAGGLRLLRYGSLHGSILGIEAVLPDGRVLDLLSKLRKDNTGYDLKQLFIGSEGTLGIITKISILCPAKPSSVNVALLGIDSYENVQKTFGQAKAKLGEILSAFEFMDLRTQQIVMRHTGKQYPLDGEHPFYVLIETSGSVKEHDDAKLESMLEGSMEKGYVADGVIAQDESQVKDLWAWRENITENLPKDGGVYKYDLSIPLPVLYDIVEDVRNRLTLAGLVGPTDKFPVVDVVGYGHIGDGNLHLNIPVRRYTKETEKAIEPYIYEWVAKHRGSISAEHGLGLVKKNYIGYSKSPGAIRVMKDIKKLFDPTGILNPYKYL